MANPPTPSLSPGWNPPRQPLDPDAYLVARTDLGRPCRAESTEPLLAAITPSTAAQTPTITTTHAHNPAYSPTSENLPPAPLHYSTLASRPDEEDAHTLVRRIKRLEVFDLHSDSWIALSV